MKLRFPESQIAYWAKRYSYQRLETRLVAMRARVKNAAHLTKRQLRLLARWKSPRSAPHIEHNSESFVREVSGFAMAAIDERARIEALTLLDGVLWPTASVALHLFHVDDYPILDFRALWSVGEKVPAQYTFECWLPYVTFCRAIARRNGVSMRVLDRALWQYSKEHQPRNGS